MEHGEGSKGKRPLDVGQDALPKAKRNQLVLFENDQYVKREATSTVQPGGGSQRVAPFTPLRSISSDGPRTEGSRMPVSAQQPLTAMPPPLAPRPAHLPRPGPHFFANPAARQAPIVDYQLMLEITSGRYHPYSRIAVPVARILMHPMFVPVMPPLHPQFHPVVVLVVPVMMMEIPIQAALPPQPAQVHQMPQLYLQQQMQQQMQQQLQQQLQQQMQQQMQQQLQQQLQQQTQPQMYQAPPPWQQNLNQVVANVENQLGHPLRADGPILGVEFDDPPPSAHQGPQE